MLNWSYYTSINERPDVVTELTVSNQVYKKFAVDLTIVSPFHGVRKGTLTEPSDAELVNVDKRADKAAKDKCDVYNPLCGDRFTFVPFVM